MNGRQRSSGIAQEIQAEDENPEISANYPQSAFRDKVYAQDEDDGIINNNLEDQRMTGPDLKIDTISEGKTGFQDSEEFKKLISQLNKTLENLKHQDEVYKKGKM